ncbi:MAG TPA: cysteine rich repeat-containing protein [Bradyrhizobium sp.]|nr:cysteine rich repeat-containing protein [Bradyrhizobium sp.]
MPKFILALILAFAATPMAFAQGKHEGTPQEQQACSRDASRFCRKQLGDDRAVRSCLEQHRKKLTRVCQEVFRSHGV